MRSAVLLLSALLAAACGNGKVAEERVRPVITQTVAPGATATRDVYSGELRARHETDLAFRVGGKIVARLADAGSRVKKGQVLARLDPEDAMLAAQAAAAQLASAESDAALAKAELERHAELLAKKFISQSAYDVKHNAFNAARARAEQARSQAAISANQQEYTTLVADADGVVISVSGEPGQVVAAGQPVLKLARAGEMEVVLTVPEGQLSRFKAGQPVAVSLWAEPSAPFAGRVREIAGGADPVTRTYAVRVNASAAPSAAQLGMTANVAFADSEQPDLVVLPMSAVTRQGDRAAVWIVDPATGKVATRAVTIGQFREDGVTITAGLAAGDVVVTAGVHKLRPGQSVRLASARPPASAANSSN